MRVKIQGGTAQHGETPLCQTCRYATIVKGVKLSDEIVECAQLAYGRGRITFPVTYCTTYSDRRQPSLREMEEIAWVLRTNARLNEIGFVRASKLRERLRHVLIEE
jgi:hypothetical protein